jgi:hypothetical protein
VNADSSRTLTAYVMHAQPYPLDPEFLGGLPYRDFLELGAYETAPGMARGRLVNVLREWSLREFEDVACLVLSELVTNAVAATAGCEWEGGQPPVRLWVRGGLAVVALLVWDAIVAAPVPRAAGNDDETGRGLAIVAELSARWGFYHPAHAGGKVTWAVIDTA